MAARRAVVACHAAAMPEVVPDGIAGKLVAPGDADALATALIDLLRDRERAELLGQQGAEHVEAYDAPRVAARFLEAIRGVVGRKA